MMKRRFLPLAILLILPRIAFCQTAMDTLFEAADRVAAELPLAPGGRGHLLVGGILLNTVPVQLGDLFADLLTNRITSRDGFDGDVVKQYTSPQYPVDQASLVLSGSLYHLDAGYVLAVQLLNSEGFQLRGWEFAMEAEGIEELLNASVLLKAGGLLDRFEPNDEVADAAFLELPFNAEKLTLGEDDEDWFAINVAPNQDDAIFILNAVTTGSTDTYLEVYAPDELDLVRAENDDSDGSNAVIELPLAEPGLWYLKVRAYSPDHAGDYGLKVWLEPGSFGPEEPDEGGELANRLNVGTAPLEKMMDYASDADWFRINLVRPLGGEEVLRIETLGSMDLVMELTDEYGLGLLDDDDSGHEKNAMIMARDLATGAYYLIVSSYSGETGPYEVMANIIIPPRDDF